MTHPATAAILRWFEYEHLRSAAMRDVSKRFHDLAHELADILPGDPEATVALRKLLESKDAAVRAVHANDTAQKD